MAPFEDPVFWEGTWCIWKTEASEILIEQGLEERGARALPMLSLEDTLVFWNLSWGGRASEILDEQAF